MSNSTPALADGQAGKTEQFVCSLFGVGRLSLRKLRRTLPETVSSGEWSVYKLYDCDSRLLYVGVSKRVARRLHEHEQSKKWWMDVALVKVERYQSAKDAKTVEKHAVVWLCPLHNKQHNIGRRLEPNREPVSGRLAHA